MDAGIWTRFAQDPRRPENAHLRASDRDRDVVNDILGDALADGRITMDELDERTSRVASAKTLGDLPPLLADLVPAAPTTTRRVDRLGDPAARRAEAERRYVAERRNAVQAFLYPTLVCLAIWAATDFGGFFWPAFVMIACAGRPAYLFLNRLDRTTSIERSLERKHERALRSRERRERQSQPLPEPDQGS
ncbi:MAG TPA: DUF1707 domain-containing protein [Marmoricola sp.]|nr:DUF1707 domain-containing protein [Marmoricola sp.]